ncbi:hypothetical protein SAMN06272771_0629 [Streptomyces sp. Ag82_O1-12]|nr:hypothetical protein SAMN06272771_0629 [Streptomyces sp. Ag82_O1-12]SOD43360.1 hypothetical protein SAMN06272727_0618 [Streptomyces sp. Ag82_G6-1]
MTMQRRSFLTPSAAGAAGTGMSKDVSEVITRTPALNTAGGQPAGHINTAVGVGVSGCGGVCTATQRPATALAPTPPPARPPGNPP